jgi:hypothetical protein
MSNIFIYMSILLLIRHKHLQLSEPFYLFGRTTKTTISVIRFPSLKGNILHTK